MRSILRQPALHFVLIGIAIWLFSWYRDDLASRQVDAPTAQEITELVADWSSRSGRIADAEVRDALVREEIERRMLFAEALRLGLHLHDPVVLGRLYQDAVFLGIDAPQDEMIDTALELQLHHGDDLIRRRMVERMRTLSVGSIPRATREELQSVFDAHTSNWTQPARVSFEHIYLRPSDSSQNAWADAKIRADQMLQDGPNGATDDPFLHGQTFDNMTARQLKDTFGGQIPDALNHHPEHEWFGPVASHYGWHLLRISRREPERPANFEQVRVEVMALWEEQTKRQRLAQYLQHLRARYRINS